MTFIVQIYKYLVIIFIAKLYILYEANRNIIRLILIKYDFYKAGDSYNILGEFKINSYTLLIFLGWGLFFSSKFLLTSVYRGMHSVLPGGMKP